MKSWKRWLGIGFGGLCVLWLTGTALAQEAGDPPGRVMRLQYLAGQVSLQPGGEEDWSEANLNRPLTTADRIWVDEGGRAELTMGSAAVRLGSTSAMSLTNLDDQTAQIELDQGTMLLTVRQLDPGEIVEVDTPNFAFTVQSPGEYRFEVYPDRDESLVTVRRGYGEASGNGGSVPVQVGQQFRFSQGQSLAYDNRRAPRPDGFEEWCSGRERREIESASLRYVAPGTIGYADLDDNGDWRTEGEYGAVWYPRVGPDWAPYRAGHWAWIEPWGWTWVDDAPWGFAPFHYGRWAQVRGRWGWIPGPVAVRPVYAPALVAWVGGVSIGVGGGVVGGGVGWFPLGWHDPFIPTYHVSPRYARQVNVSSSRVVNVTVVNNYYNTTNVNIRNTTINNIHYENRQVHGAMTGMPRGEFAAGRPMRDHAVAIGPGNMRQGSVMAGADVAPTRTAVFGGRGPAQAPRGLVVPKQVVAKTPPPAAPVGFERQRSLLEQNRGVPLAPQQRMNLGNNQPGQGRPGMARPTVINAGKPGNPPTAAPGRNNNTMPGQPGRGNFNPQQQPQQNVPGQQNPTAQPGNQQGTRPGERMNDRMNERQGNQPGNQPGNQGGPSRQPSQGAQPAQATPQNAPAQQNPRQGNQPGNQMARPAPPAQSIPTPGQTNATPQRPAQPLRPEDRPPVRPAPVQNRSVPAQAAPGVTPNPSPNSGQQRQNDNRTVTPPAENRPQTPPARNWENRNNQPQQQPQATRPAAPPQQQQQRPAPQVQPTPQAQRPVPQQQTQPQAARPAPPQQPPARPNAASPKDNKKDNKDEKDNKDKRNDH